MFVEIEPRQTLRIFQQSYKNLKKIFENILQGVKIIFLEKF